VETNLKRWGENPKRSKWGRKRKRVWYLKEESKAQKFKKPPTTILITKLSHSQTQKLTRSQDMDLTMQPETRKSLEPCVT